MKGISHPIPCHVEKVVHRRGTHQANGALARKGPGRGWGRLWPLARVTLGARPAPPSGRECSTPHACTHSHESHPHPSRALQPSESAQSRESAQARTADSWAIQTTHRALGPNAAILSGPHGSHSLIHWQSRSGPGSVLVPLATERRRPMYFTSCLAFFAIADGLERDHMPQQPRFPTAVTLCCATVSTHV